MSILTMISATYAPYLGVELQREEPAEGDGPGTVRVRATRGPSAHVPAPSVLVSVGAEGGAPLAVEATDLLDEPDYFDRYDDMARFFARQTELHAVTSHERVTLTVREGEGPPRAFVVTPLPRRPLGSLPGVFWFQIGAGCVGALVALWVLALRPGVTGVRMFAVTGVAILAFTAPAAVYSTRELALDGSFVRALSTLNHLGANVFGIGLACLFLRFPKPLVRARTLWLLPALFVSWWALDATRLAPDQTWGSRVPILLEMLSAIAFAVVQWRRSKADPRARASLRWFGVSVLSGAGLFVFTVGVAPLLGMFPPIEQGYSFGFFLLMHVGLALGLRRTRLFELNELSYLVLLWVLGALALIAVDAAVLYLLDANRFVSSGVALLFVSVAYLPVRSWVWSRTFTRRKTDEHELFRHVLDVVFALEPEERARRWLSLFDAIFSPLEIRRSEDPSFDTVAIRDDGVVMEVPAVTSLPALVLSFPWRGRGLFGARHAQLVTSLRQLAEHAENARDAFDRGAREERARVARDLHDDVGATLTSGLYQDDPARMRQAVQSAILEMRSMVNVLSGRRLRLSDVVGDLRHETLQRLADAKLDAAWPLAELGDRTVHSTVARNWASMIRELTTNVLRHAKAGSMTVTIDLLGDRLVTTLSDDGIGFDGEVSATGNGIANLRRRAREIGASLTFTRRAPGTHVHLDAPLDPDRSEAPGGAGHRTA